jgi:hypothetical protein
MATHNYKVVGEFEHTPCVTRATPNPTTMYELCRGVQKDFGIKLWGDGGPYFTMFMGLGHNPWCLNCHKEG